MFLFHDVMTTFDNISEHATGNQPYDWQKRLANDAACQSRLIDIPTGLGKTAAVILAWLWNRVHLGKTEWPRRLVYCLPMRTLVEQTVGEIETWLKALKRKTDNDDLKWLAEHSPITLMGGEELDQSRREWHLYPEKPAILVGTQDMLLSRALNRGYGAGRGRWPIDFALLNNDCLWVMDEVQLMANGLSTSLQLQAWRYSLDTKATPDSICATAKLSTVLPTHTRWMSATMAEHWFQTAVDWRTLNLNGELAPEKLWEDRLKIEESDKTDTRVSIPRPPYANIISLFSGSELTRNTKASSASSMPAGPPEPRHPALTTMASTSGRSFPILRITSPLSAMRVRRKSWVKSGMKSWVKLAPPFSGAC